MRSSKRGHATSKAEFQSRSADGFWLVLGKRRTFLDFESFPWFRHARTADLADVVLLGADHLRWERLDIDLSIDSIEHPERYPLMSPVGARRQAEVREPRRKRRS
jgi:hypothetical protein